MSEYRKTLPKFLPPGQGGAAAGSHARRGEEVGRPLSEDLEAWWSVYDWLLCLALATLTLCQETQQLLVSPPDSEPDTVYRELTF